MRKTWTDHNTRKIPSSPHPIELNISPMKGASAGTFETLVFFFFFLLNSGFPWTRSAIVREGEGAKARGRFEKNEADQVFLGPGLWINFSTRASAASGYGAPAEFTASHWMSSNCFPWENSSCEFTATFYWRVEGEACAWTLEEDRFRDGWCRGWQLWRNFILFFYICVEVVYIEREIFL